MITEECVGEVATRYRESHDLAFVILGFFVEGTILDIGVGGGSNVGVKMWHLIRVDSGQVIPKIVPGETVKRRLHRPVRVCL